MTAKQIEQKIHALLKELETEHYVRISALSVDARDAIHRLAEKLVPEVTLVPWDN